ncbi:unnamed protein product [Brugia timori]|uniref:Uncharacterized protein n=1 Tax=Brugia timori TaxID=42155 RepID=A0A3P7VBC9_9BILA|nr:unnamed protein product [Brugia timori]
MKKDKIRREREKERERERIEEGEMIPYFLLFSHVSLGNPMVPVVPW